MAVYGIDLGTTYSAIAKLDTSLLPAIIPNVLEDSDPTIPSVIYFESEDDGGNIIVGKQAKANIADAGDRVVEFIKRSIGEEGQGIYHFNGKEYDPVSLSAIILKQIKNYAEKQEGEIRDVVITVPAYFDQARREATRKAGELAGFNVLNTINEPTAAALAYVSSSTDQKPDAYYLVYDLGGGTFDVSLIHMVKNGESYSVEIIATAGDSMLGGADWDAALSDIIREKYYSENMIDASDEPSEELHFAIKQCVEKAKRDLTMKTSANVKLRCDGGVTKVSVTRDEFEAATTGLVAKTIALVNQVLSESADRVSKDQIDLVLLVGGSTKMPMIENELKKTENFGPERVRTHEPDWAVAKGAVLYASLLPDPNIKRLEDALNEFRSKYGRGATAKDWPEIYSMMGYETPITSTTEPPQNAIINTGGEVDEGTGEIVINTKRPEEPRIKIEDVSPSAFGPCVLDDDMTTRVVVNMVKEGDKIPLTVSKDDFATPAADMSSISIQVFESKTREEKVPPCVDKDGNEIPCDPTLQMKYRGRLHIPLPPNTPQYTRVSIRFEIDEAGKVTMFVDIPSLGISDQLAFTFFEYSTVEAQAVVDEAVQRLYLEE